jgi:hypothetical protein
VRERKRGGDSIKSLFLITLYYKTIKVLQLKLKKMRKELNRKKILIKVKVKPVKSKEFDNANLNKKVNMSYVNAPTENINQKFHN